MKWRRLLPLFHVPIPRKFLFRSVVSYLPSLKLRLIQSSDLCKIYMPQLQTYGETSRFSRLLREGTTTAFPFTSALFPPVNSALFSAGTVFTYTSEGRINTVVRCWFPFSSRLIPSHSGWQICESPMNSKFERSRKSRRTLSFHEMFPTNFV